MIKEFYFNSPTKGGKTKILINDGTITISRPGIMSKFSHGFSGEKTILINTISAVQLKKAGLGRGYIQLIIPGTREAKSGLISGDIDENIIYFDSTLNNTKVNKSAEEIKNYIENYNRNTNNTITNSNNKYNELKQLKDLLDNNVITQEEFEKEKQKILNA